MEIRRPQPTTGFSCPDAIHFPRLVWAAKESGTVNADQMLGSVFISRMNVMLPDQSNREGIMETPEFLLLQEFLQGILGILEKDRQYISRIFSDDYDKKHPAKKIQDDINQKAAQQKKEREKAEAEGKQNQAPSGETAVDAEQAKRLWMRKMSRLKNWKMKTRCFVCWPRQELSQIPVSMNLKRCPIN